MVSLLVGNCAAKRRSDIMKKIQKIEIPLSKIAELTQLDSDQDWSKPEKVSSTWSEVISDNGKEYSFTIENGILRILRCALDEL